MATVTYHPPAPGHPVLAPSRPHHRHPAPPPLVARGAPPAVEWSAVVSRAFHASAGGYAVASGGMLLPQLRALIPDLAMREGAVTHLGMTLAAAGLCLAAGMAYRLPAALDRRLWSVPLAWLHFALLHAAYLGAATGFYAYHAAQDGAWWAWLGWGGAVSAAGVALMAINVYESVREHAAPTAPPTAS